MLRQLELEDMDAAARVVRAAFDHALPSLAGLHTSKEDRLFFRERVFETCEVRGCFRRRRDDRNDRLPKGLDRPIVRAARRATAWRQHRVAASRQTLVRSPAALDVPAQRAGPTLLRSERLRAGPGNRRREK